MPASARVTRAEHRFAIYHDDELVARVTTIDGIDEAVTATEATGHDPHVYVPGLHIAGIADAPATQWFESWRRTGLKRDLVILDRTQNRTVRVVGAFVGAWSDGTWYDLIIDAATLDA